MEDLVNLLGSFNRKERFFLVRQAVGSFQLCDQFRHDLGEAIGVGVITDAFAAMDFHLDWLAAALVVHRDNAADNAVDNSMKLVTGTQEDIDLLVAFRKDGTHHLVLVEAKGETSWTNSQMRSKAGRLKDIFGDEGDCYPGVEPHLCLMSPNPPEGLHTDHWPKWMKSFGYLKLDFPEDRTRVIRCGIDGKPSAAGEYFKIRLPASTEGVNEERRDNL